MSSFSRLVFALLAALCAMSLAAPRQLVFGLGKRSDVEDDGTVGVPYKRYKPKGFAMGFGKRGLKKFTMGFGKRSSAPIYDEDTLYF